MYELPEYVEGREYWLVGSVGTVPNLTILKFRCENNRDHFNFVCNNGLLFANHELAQIEADRRNAQNKLMNLAREREKEFPIDLDSTEQIKIYFEFSTDGDISGRICDYYESSNNPCFAFGEYNKGWNASDLDNEVIEEAEDWLRSVMTEQEIKALCMPRRFV